MVQCDAPARALAGQDKLPLCEKAPERLCSCSWQLELVLELSTLCDGTILLTLIEPALLGVAGCASVWVPPPPPPTQPPAVNTADVFTKHLPVERHRELAAQLRGGKGLGVML